MAQEKRKAGGVAVKNRHFSIKNFLTILYVPLVFLASWLMGHLPISSWFRFENPVSFWQYFLYGLLYLLSLTLVIIMMFCVGCLIFRFFEYIFPKKDEVVK